MKSVQIEVRAGSRTAELTLYCLGWRVGPRLPGHSLASCRSAN